MSSITELQSFSSVPKLEVNGSNWIIFAIRLKWALQDKKVYTHLDGTSAKPDDAAPTDDASLPVQSPATGEKALSADMLQLDNSSHADERLPSNDALQFDDPALLHGTAQSEDAQQDLHTS